MTEHDPRLLIQLRIGGFASIDSISRQLDIPTDVARSHLGGHVRSGFVMHRQGARPGYLLTKAGRLAAESHMQRELSEQGHAEAVEVIYERFLPVNTEFLSVCSRWQLFEGAGPGPVLNDHSDEAYDHAVLEALDVVHRSALELASELRGTVERLGGYGYGLVKALDSFRAGDERWLLSPRIPSYHTVWMEWHQDLLATLGRTRTEERG